MESPVTNKIKGLSVFQRLFISHMILGFVIFFFFGFLYYTHEKENIKAELKSTFSYTLKNAVNYFDRVYKTKIREDFDYIEGSYSFNTFLSSSNEDIVFALPLAEDLFLNFTSNPKGLYLSARFIDMQGNEKVITQGNRRIRNYKILATPFFSHVHALYQRVRAAPLDTILFEGPFKYKNKMTFLVGKSKRDPEVGGLAGVVIFHCDLTDYFNYLGNQLFEKEHIAKVVTLDNKLIFAPPADNVLSNYSYNLYSDSQTVNMGSDNQGLFKVIFFVSSNIFDTHLHEAFKYSILWIFLSILPISLAAYLVSRYFSRPLISLVSHVDRLAKGDLSIRANVKATGEVGVLIESFNNLAADLYKTKVSREELIGELKMKVAERKKAEEELGQSVEELQKEVIERKKAEEKLEQSVGELERFNKTAVNREERMIELKQKINQLSEELGQHPPYDLSFLNENMNEGSGS